MNNTSRRSILIVEDEFDWYEIIAESIHDVLSDIGHVSDYEVIYAQDYQQALDLLKNKTFTLVSMDINLTKTEGASQGFALLEHLRTSAAETFSIIVSGETDRQYMREGFRKYNILQYIDKAPWTGPNEQELKNTVKSILLYADAIDYFRVGEWERANDSLERARQVMQFQEIDVLVETAKLKVTHHITGLPTGEAVNAKLRELLRMNRSWSVLYIKVEHIEKYYETYGHIDGGTALKTIGRFIQAQAGQSSFVAHIGQDLFFVMAGDHAQLESLQNKLDSFNLKRDLDTHLYPLEDRDRDTKTVKAGKPKLTLAIRQVSDQDGPFTDIIEISRKGSEGSSRN